MKRESVLKTMGVAFGVSLVCSILVSATVVSLHALQKENEKRVRIRSVYVDLDLLREGESVSDVNERTRFFVIEMKTGRELPEDRWTGILEPGDFNVKAVANDPEYGIEVPPDKDMAGIRRMPKYMALFTVYENDAPVKYVLPIYGSGLYSTLYGYIALGADLRTVEGISFYEHGETPGLGGEIDNPRWKESWKGKLAFDEEGNVIIRVIKGVVDPKKPEARYQIDGLSGATFTTRGVNDLVRFWLGEDAYGPFFRRAKSEG